jgi:lipopolysaccharide export system protein LptA
MRSAPLSLLLVLLGAGGVMAQNPAGRKELPRKKFSPVLDLLPAGSTIKDVRIPRFDKEKRPAALLRARVLKIISEQKIRGEDIRVRVFSKKEEELLRVHMSTAEFDQSTGILKAKELITLAGESVKGRGTGGIFLLDTRQGFIRGPVFTTFIRPPEKKEERENEQKKDESTPPVPRPVVAEFVPEFLEPTGLTPTERRELNALLKSRSKSVLADRAPTRAFMTRSQQLSQAAEVSFRSFTNRIKQGNVLAKVSTGDPTPLPGRLGAKLGQGEIIITCEGGMYLDPEKGQISYLRNIEVTEARFQMTCSGHLKIFFERRDLAKSSQNTIPEDLSDLKTIVASGGVRVVRNDPQGKRPPITATAETAIVDVRTGDVVLQGGTPTIQQGLNSIRAGDPDLYLRFYANGNVFAEEGRWTTVGDLASLQEEKENEKGKEDSKKTEGEEATGPAPDKVPASDEVADPEKVGDPDNDNAAKEEKPQTITATCTGGIYFDAKDGHIVYLGEIEITEPRFSIFAKDELKVFLRRKSNPGEEQLEGPEAWSDVDHIVASGEVTLVRNDPGGKRAPVTAKAEHAVFNVRTSDLLLQGGTPAIRQGSNALEAGERDLYLRFYENGSLFAEPGKWTTRGDLANLRTKSGEKQNSPNIIAASCKGGLYFDSFKGQIVYLDDIVVVDSRFRLNCTGIMRIHLKVRENAEKGRLEGPEAFSDVDKIVATGGVTVTRKDPRGKAADVTASAETATYEARTGNIVLRGGYPLIQQGKSFLKAREKALYLLFFANGSFYAKKGKWENSLDQGDFDELRKQHADNNGN